MPNLTIEEIKKSISIVELADKYGAHPKSRTGKTIPCKYNVLRPTDTHSNLTLYPHTNTWADFGNKGGSIIDFIMLAENIPLNEAVSRIKSMAGITDDTYTHTPKTINPTPSQAYMLPDIVKKIWSQQKTINFENEAHKKEMLSIAPEWLYKEADKEDLKEFFEVVKFDNQHQTAFILLKDLNNIERSMRYRRFKKRDEYDEEIDVIKWCAFVGTQSNFPYTRLKKDNKEVTLIVEGTHDYLTAILCGCNVIALPSSGYKLSDDLLKDRLCIFIDDDDGKNFMRPLYDEANCSKIWFNHDEFKKTNGIEKAKDFSDYLGHFSSLEAFKEAFNNQINIMNNSDSIAVKNRLKRVSDLTKNIIPPAWMVRNIIPEEGLIEIIGASGSYKSFLILDLMFCISNGIKYHGKETKKGTVVYIAGEGHHGAKMRIRALEMKYQVPADNFYMLECSSNLAEEKEMDKLSNEILSISDDKISMIMFDTLHRNSSGIDENSASDFSLILGNVDKYLKPYVKIIGYIHHTGNAQETSNRGRGTSSRFAAMDTSLMVKSKEKGFTSLSCNKQKDGEAFEMISFELEKIDIDLLDEDGEKVYSVVPIITDKKFDEEEEMDDKTSDDEYAQLIYKYLLTIEEANTNTIKEAMNGKVGGNKCHKILKDKKYKQTHWCNFKKEGSKNEWVYKARQKSDGCQVVEYTEEDYKVELPSCLL